ncbi:hypothetical protein HYN59_00585 [Flavobacterium album]|uniref:HTH luxR-type domain-containing protein n=1 Tax=Flavobacterium album TaxID=2175091 RepID=A0A2S1QTX0_9FLAO|nr:sigma-70 family RNA polymerase sigma factor [Flavobacterium album]AWH83701.1 hypothetical protein HYN59_00585 [Flavobacterium album]
MRAILTNKSKVLQRVEFDKVSEILSDNYLFNKYENKYIPEYFCWTYNIANSSFKFIGNPRSFSILCCYTPSQFLKKIKACFRSQFTDAAKGFHSMLTTGIILTEGIYLSVVVPILFSDNKFWLCKITVIPVFRNRELSEFVLIVIPVKQYINSNITFSIIENGIHNPVLTSNLKKYINPPDIKLTKKQQFVLSASHKGLSASEIAGQLGVVVDSVYKINRRLMEKISDFFELTFKDAKEAGEYYYNSFI